jgi:hypothetical protein
MSCLLSLPDEVIKLIMQHVPIKHRLNTCCLVHKKLHAAAVAATQGLQVHSLTDREDSWLIWMDRFGHQLTSLAVQRYRRTLLQLPCPNLLELVLNDCNSVQLGPTAVYGTSGVIQGCTKLTRLEVCGGLIFDEGAVVDCLSNLVHLQHLVLRAGNPAWLCSATLHGMQHLTHLNVHSLPADNLLQLGALTKLQQLHLRAVGGTLVGPSRVPNVALPVSLTKLVLVSPIKAGLLLSIPAGLQHLGIADVSEGPDEGPPLFLPGMSRLQHLTCLRVDGRDMDWPPVGPAYSALAASSKLVDFSMRDADLPQGTWAALFCAERKLPHLTYLNLYNDVYGDDYVVGLAWNASDVRSLVSCCPNLRAIASVSLQHGLHVSVLHKLTALTMMHMIYGRDGLLMSVEKSMNGLAALTQLKQLKGSLGRDVSMGDLLPLTRLTALTELRMISRPGSGGEDSNSSSDDSDDDDLSGVMVLLEKCKVSQLSCMCDCCGPSTRSDDGPSKHFCTVVHAIQHRANTCRVSACGNLVVCAFWACRVAAQASAMHICRAYLPCTSGRL